MIDLEVKINMVSMYKRWILVDIAIYTYVVDKA